MVLPQLPLGLLHRLNDIAEPRRDRSRKLISRYLNLLSGLESGRTNRVNGLTCPGRYFVDLSDRVLDYLL